MRGNLRCKSMPDCAPSKFEASQMHQGLGHRVWSDVTTCRTPWLLKRFRSLTALLKQHVLLMFFADNSTPYS